MKNPQPTKEYLKKEVATLTVSLRAFGLEDENRRKEFAKAFNWVKNARYAYESHIEKEPQLPSWEQIFVQVGKLLMIDETRKEAINAINLLNNATGNRTTNPESNH